MYLANHYVRINGKMLKRGEKIPEGLPQGKIEWLLSAGAIKEIAPASLGEPEEVPEDTEDATEDAEDAAQQAEGEEPGTEDAAEEADDEAEAPEIDVMSGIVAGETEEEPKKTTRRTSAKKQTGRRK
jgi:nucleotide-binding universal stress UspA family protein